MIEIEIDGKKVEVAEGSMVMHAAEKAGTYIPHFCYHKKLSIAASCRMCLVDVEKAPKALPACATPVTNGMIVRTSSDKAVTAQQSVMEFLLINHPLDCPICDQGGECQLQDLAVGYGASSSRYTEEKRVVDHKDVGSLISMEEMSRCIHCTRCVRFGQEIAGVMELGMSHRGEHAEIETFLSHSIDSELSGNMIDICPVGALTSKPFRYSARTWELSRRKSVSPHDSTGSNLIIQVKNSRVMRVVPFENESVNECWIADRDRFSYEALNSQERLTSPMLKQGGKWIKVDWQTALEYIANGIKNIQAENSQEKQSNNNIAALVSPHSTVEEIYLLKSLINGLGSGSIDYRLRNNEFTNDKSIKWLGRSIESLSKLNSALIVGSNLRKDHPLFAQRIRQAVTRNGAQLSVITSDNLLSEENNWAMPIAYTDIKPDFKWLKSLSSLILAVAEIKKISPPVEIKGEITDFAKQTAQMLINSEQKAILLGNLAAHHDNASKILNCAKWIAKNTGATVGYLTQAANTVGAQVINALPSNNGLNAKQILEQNLGALFLLNCEPSSNAAMLDTSIPLAGQNKMVVTLSPFKANMEISDVLLPVSPFTETSGSFINAQGLLQSFHAAVKPLGEARPAWKVLRVIADMLDIKQPAYQTSQEVLKKALPNIAHDNIITLNDLSVDAIDFDNFSEVLSENNDNKRELTPVGIYQLDSIVRRAKSLQMTSDAKNNFGGGNK